MQSLVVLVLLGVSAVICQTPQQFQASFTITADPNVLGILTGTINYDATNKFLRNDYTLPSGTIGEYFDFTKHLRYLYCNGVCDASTWTTNQPTYFNGGAATASGNVATINGQSCSEYVLNDPANPVQTVWFAASGLPCRAVYFAVAGNTGTVSAKTIEFTNLAPLNSAVFLISSWNCPVQQCNKMIDFVLIFDESGSIAPADFVREVNFGSAIASNYVFGPASVGMALVQFSGDARLTIALSFVQASFLNAMSAVFQRGGSTCIGCGITDAVNEIAADGRHVSTVFILLTDGMNNVDVAQFPAILAAAKAGGVIFFAIGVGPFVSQAEINTIASVIPGAQTSFPAVPTFSALQGIVAGLVLTTCINIPGTPCGPACQGFCACKGTCVCPSLCNDNNLCTTDACNPAVNGAGCTYTPIVCNDNNFCTTKTCIPATGCMFTPITCVSPDACHNSTCFPASGCAFTPVNCNDGNPCHLASCNLQTGCQYAPQNCSHCLYPTPVVCPPIPCNLNECNVLDGLCVATPINCDDMNACTFDSCNVTTGQCQHLRNTCDDMNACTHDFCDPVTGCYHVPFNVSVDCNDYNACTTKTCNPAIGCVYTNVTCDDHNYCTSNNCSSFSGCFFPPLNCLSIPRISKLIGTCYQALCANVSMGCFLQQIPGTTIDSCGVCNGNNQCVFVPLPSNVPYAIGGALLAVIIIGSVIVCVALGAFGGKKGYDIWLKHRNNMSGANTNPLYNDNGLSGNNPMYSDRA